MKKFFGHKLCASLVLAFLFSLIPLNAFAATSHVFVNGNSEDLYVASGSKSSTNGTATYTASTKTLTLKNYSGKTIASDVDGLKIVSNGSNRIIADAGKAAISVKNGSLTISGGSLNLGSAALVVENGNLTIENINLTASSIGLTDTDSTVQNKITIGNGAIISLSGAMTAQYSFNATTKGIVLNSSICVSPSAEIKNIKSGSLTVSTFTANGTSKLNNFSLSSSNCAASGNGGTVENPDTIDTVYIYVAILVASSAILLYRRHIVKR